jgi:hypothetical protein
MTEKNDLAMIKAENERLLADIEKLKQRLREEISRTLDGVRLDLNLEKGRMRGESSGQELKITEVDTRIEQEIAGLRTAIQASKVSARPTPQILHRHPICGLLFVWPRLRPFNTSSDLLLDAPLY